MKNLIKVFTLVLIVGMFLGCQKKSDNTTLIVSNGAPKSIDPYAYYEIPGLFVDKQIYDTLLERNSEGNIVPKLAESYEYISPTEILFKLKKGIKFHNGEELKSSDVVFSINRMLQKPGSKNLVEDIAEVKAVDDYSFKLFLKNPSASLLFALAHPITSIMNEKDVVSKNDDVNSAPVGTGPFKFESMENKDKITLVANENYYLGAPKIKTIIFKNITESSSKLAALETGEIDIATGISPVDNETILKNKDLDLISEPTVGVEYIFVNNKKSGLNIKEVRQAIAYAVDKKGIVDSVYSGAAKVAEGIMSPEVFASYTPEKKYDYNIEKAKELLKSVGKDKGLKFKIWTTDGIRVQVAQIIQANLKEIGIETEIEILEWSAYLEKSAKGEHDLLLGGWVAGTFDADIGLNPLFHTNNIGGAGNRAFYSNKTVDSLIENGRAEINVEKRKEIYKEVQEILNEELPVIPLVLKNENIGLNKKVKNFKYNGSLMYPLYETYKE